MSALANPLSFQSKKKEVTAPYLAEEVLVDFHFENSSDQAVVISHFEAPCECMSATLEGGRKQINGVAFKPGEKGVFKGKFIVKEFKGVVENSKHS